MVSGRSDPPGVDAVVEPRAEARQRALSKAYLTDLRRAIVISMIGAATWPFFVLYDVLQTVVLGRGDLLPFLVLRLLGEVILVLSVLALRRQPPLSHRDFHRLKAAVMFSFSALLAAMCVATSDLASIYVAGNMGVALALIFVPQRFWQALGTVYLTLVAHPLVLTIGVLVRPSLAAQLDDPHVVGRLAQYAFVLVFLGLAIAGFSHVFHRMRKQLDSAHGIGRYTLRRLVGEGASSEIWVAYHAGLEREVALKLLETTSERDYEAKRRFAREVRATAQLTHPNAIRIFDHGATEEGVLYYAMERLEGATLGEFVQARGPLAVGRAVHLARQAAAALEEAHAHGIVHRDVKPENFMVCHGGLEPDFLKVLDFGIATVAVEVAAGTQVSGGELAGTPKTMSPEVIRGAPATPASDVYGMGVVLYFMLTGEYPFSASSSLSLYVSHIRDTPTAPSLMRGDRLPEDLEGLVLRCLEKDPEKRPRDAGALLYALDGIAARHPWRPRIDALAADTKIAKLLPGAARRPDGDTLQGGQKRRRSRDG